MFANMLSEYNLNPNPDFERMLRYQETDLSQNDNGEISHKLINGTDLDIFSNQFIESGRTFSKKFEEFGNIGDQIFTGFPEKAAWYISYKPLPTVIAENPYVLHDLSACAAKMAMIGKTLNSIRMDE